MLSVASATQPRSQAELLSIESSGNRLEASYQVRIEVSPEDAAALIEGEHEEVRSWMLIGECAVENILEWREKHTTPEWVRDPIRNPFFSNRKLSSP